MVEHDALEIWNDIKLLISKIIKKNNLNFSNIISIGIANQRETTVLWNKKNGIPVNRAIVWQDRRTSNICDKLKRKKLDKKFSRITGLVIDPYFSGTKIKWILDNNKKAKILFKIANKFNSSGRKSSARSYARKALGFQPSLGRAYLLIANLYADSANDCGDNQFNKRAVYWLATKEALKAGNVDSSLRKIAKQTAESYNGRATSKTDIFTEGNEGTTIAFNCWIKSSVKVPLL